MYLKNKMSELICLRLLGYENPSEPLVGLVSDIKLGENHKDIFVVDTSTFIAMPAASFSYWLPHETLKLFAEAPSLEAPERKIKQGLGTGDDFRFVRCMWEVPVESVGRWLPFAKGGEYSNFYAEHYLRVNWEKSGEEMRTFEGSTIRNDGFYFLPGVTWSDRTTKSFSVRAWPAGGVFSVKGSAGFFYQDNLYALGLMNSAIFNDLLMAMVGAADSAARSYQVGVIGSVPFIEPSSVARRSIATASLSGWRSRRLHYVFEETSNYFTTPFRVKPSSVAQSLDVRSQTHDQSARGVRTALSDINSVMKDIYGLEPSEAESTESIEGLPGETDEPPEISSLTAATEAFKILSYVIGVAFSRWDIQFVENGSLQELTDDPFEALPFRPLGSVHARSNFAPSFFVNDIDQTTDELIDKIREILGEIWGAESAAIEEDICQSISESSLGAYFMKSGGFFASHLSMYTKSRRQAPIYWPLSTKSGGLIIWVYYPAVNENTLPRIITEVLDPRIRNLNQDLSTLPAGPESVSRKASLEFKFHELMEMRAELQRLIDSGYRPNNNDGVLITAAPLAKFFRHAKFRKDLEACWKELARGDYDWAHLAMAMWPERVLQACRADRSIAIAHRREDLCPPEAPRPARGRRQSA